MTAHSDHLLIQTMINFSRFYENEIEKLPVYTVFYITVGCHLGVIAGTLVASEVNAKFGPSFLSFPQERTEFIGVAKAKQM